MYKTTIDRPKLMFFFSQLTLLFYNLVLTSYLSGIYLESWSSSLWARVQKTLKKRGKQAEEKCWKVKREKNEDFEKSQITTIYIFGFKFYFARKQNSKKVVYTIEFCWQCLCVAGYLKHSNDRSKLNIHKYTNII